MKKILSKKLQLRSTTIAILTGPNLGRVIGGATGPTEGAGITSRVDEGGHVLCQTVLSDGLGCTTQVTVKGPGGAGEDTIP
ncbi:MAG TPA: hypothetical protein VLM79_19120 [Kofleriaceae bacterium]|nr:hypothetical protein [Kofleriaceae bacterium]